MNYRDNKGLLFGIQRFSVHDGPGIRTLIFFKGCSMRCDWCSNPEGQYSKQEMFFDKRKCLLCKQCILICPNNANEYIKGKIRYNRNKCSLCGKCLEVCSGEARSVVGEWISIDQIIGILNEDEVFFRNSGGGVTLGGGEPLYQYNFIKKLILKCKEENINTAVETSGYIGWEKFESLLGGIDYILFDIKHVDDKKHKRFTGVSNKIILENLNSLLSTGKRVIVRITKIPNFNSSLDDIKKIETYIRSISKNIKIEYLKYHEYGKFKYELLGRSYIFNK